MIAVDTSVILAMALAEPEADSFTALLGREAVAVPSCMVFLLIGSSPSLPHAGDCSRHWPSARR